MSEVLILGPQGRTPSLASALEAAHMRAPVAAITAGWQEREGELAALEAHLGQPVQDLHLYARAELAFAEDPELHAAYRARQSTLREMQDLYRLQLDHAKRAAREVHGRRPVTAAVRRARASAIASLRRLDARHAAAISVVHRRFEERWRPTERAALARPRAEMARTVAAASTVLIAGGHVAVLLNRLTLFNLRDLLADKPVAAWSAGAMALAPRILLFHDRPPQGAGNAELFEQGLGLVAEALFLPHARTRLALEDPERVAMLARRCAPAQCYTLDDGDWLLFRDGRLTDAKGSRRLRRSGVADAIGPAALPA
jgi:hypothetical protein